MIKLWALGDSVVLLPALKALKKEFSNAELHVLAHPRNKTVFEGQPFVDKIIDFGALNILKLFRKYDLCIDTEPALNVSGAISLIAGKFRVGFSHGVRGGVYHRIIEFNKKQHMVQNYLDLARETGIRYNTDKLIPLQVSEKDTEVVDKYLHEHSITNRDFIIAIAPGVAESVKHRMWPIDKTAQAADELVKKYDAKVIFVDSKANKPIIAKISKHMKELHWDAAGMFTVKQAAALLGKCDIVIANDSGLMHVSAAMGTKTVGLFGPNTPTLWGPYGENNISLYKPKKGCPYIDNTNPDLIPDTLTHDQETCMDAISVADIMHAVEKLRKK